MLGYIKLRSRSIISPLCSFRPLGFAAVNLAAAVPVEKGTNTCLGFIHAVHYCASETPEQATQGHSSGTRQPVSNSANIGFLELCPVRLPVRRCQAGRQIRPPTNPEIPFRVLRFKLSTVTYRGLSEWFAGGGENGATVHLRGLRPARTWESGSVEHRAPTHTPFSRPSQRHKAWYH